MADDQSSEAAAVAVPVAVAPVVAVQLTQVRVPLADAGEALSTPDSSGRLPIVVLPKHALRIRNELVVAGIIAIVVGFILDMSLAGRGAAIGLGGALIVLGVFRSFIVPVPEGSKAVLLRSSRFYKTLGPGNHVLPPWIIVSHVVTTRETPFDAPAASIPTKDNVRTNVDILMTFMITGPEKFVFTISATDFDQICQATCQENLRLLIREKDSEQVLDMSDEENEVLRAGIGETLATYGVEVVRVLLTHVVPPIEFIASRESRRLAIIQRAEEQEQHALALLRQQDRDDLERHRIAARREAIELEAANEAARLERLESRIRTYPNALHWDVEGQRLDVARGLAANTRAMVQVGQGSDVAAALLMHTLQEDGRPPAPAPEANPAPAPEPSPETTGRRRARSSTPPG